MAQFPELARSMAEVDPAVLRDVKAMYVAGWQATLGESLAVEAEIAAARPPAYDLLETRRREVLDHNRSQL
jgi:hypothetical protein